MVNIYKNYFLGLTPIALIVVPRRQFGQGKKIRIFGHSKVKVANPAPLVTYFLYILPRKFVHQFFSFFWPYKNGGKIQISFIFFQLHVWGLLCMNFFTKKAIPGNK